MSEHPVVRFLRRVIAPVHPPLKGEWFPDGSPTRGGAMNDKHTAKRILVIADEAAGDRALNEVIRSCAEGADAEILVIAPESRLDLCLEGLRATHIRARGRAGDGDPMRAVSEGLDEFAADEIVLATRARKWRLGSSRNLVERVRRRFAGPIFHVVVDPAPSPSFAARTPVPLIPLLSERR
jgi:hypothetical protein